MNICINYRGGNKTATTNINEKKVICKRKRFYVLLAFLLITNALLITVSIYCYLRKYKFMSQITN